MANADNLKRLAEEMVGAYEERVRVMSDVKQETADIKQATGRLLSDFGKAHAAMSKELKDELNRFKSEVDATEDERKKDNQGEISERKDYIMELRDKARELIDEFDKAHGDMAQTLRAELTRFKSDLDAAGDERRKIDQGETRETAEAWKGLISAMQAARGGTVVAGPVEVETAVEVKTVEEAIEEPVEEEAEEAIDEVAAAEEKIEGEDLGGRILDLIEDNPEGLKMTQIADMLDIGNWRTLIPVMRELMDDGEIRKEDTQYFLAE